MNLFNNFTESICQNACRAGLTEIGPLDINELVFEDWVRNICRDSCRLYNTSWACPPAIGTLQECRERCMRYKHMLLFNRVYPIEDGFDFEAISRAMADFKTAADLFEAYNASILSNSLYLTNEGCGTCKRCTWPDAPCRFPGKLHHSLEGYGFNVSKLAAKAGLHYTGGQNTVTFFGAVLYNEGLRKEALPRYEAEH